MEQTWHSVEKEAVPFDIDVDAEWSNIQGQLSIGIDGRSARKEPSPHLFGWLDAMISPRRAWRFAGAAAVIVILITLMVWTARPFGPSMKQMVTQNGETREITLSDGSSVRLNCSSTLAFRRSFGRVSREVYLDGEGFFEVVPATSPFIIRTDNAETTVLGTEFNVRARDDETTVIVRHGRVRVGTTARNEGKEVVLTGGEMAVIVGEAAPTAPMNVDVNAMLGWLEGKIVFVRTSFADILAELERRYDVSIDLQSPQIAEQTVTASFDQVSLATVLRSLCLTVEADFVSENDRYTIRKMETEELR
jgi:transmembrane sensor